jgi:hypothetical protein
MLRTFLILTAFTAALASPAMAAGKTDLATCKAMQAALAPRQTGINDLVARRDASAAVLEEAGQAWEDVEIHRLVSKGHAEAADAGKAAYEAARAQLDQDETALQETLQQFNADVAAFNARCTRKG